MTDFLDFDSIRAEREPKMVRIRGKEYEAAVSPSYGIMRDMTVAAATMDEDSIDPADNVAAMRLMDAFLVDIFGTEAAEEIVHVLDTQDVVDLVTKLAEKYMVGKASGPNGQQKRNGARSLQTSGGSTKSTSGKRSSAQNGSAVSTLPA